MKDEYLNSALTEEFVQKIADVFRDYRDEIDSSMLLNDGFSEDILIAIFQRSYFAYEYNSYPLLREIFRVLFCNKSLFCKLSEDDIEFFKKEGLMEE